MMIRAGSVSGDAHITMTVTDPAGASASTTFKLTVVCDGGPTVSAIPDQYAMAGITTAAIPFWLNSCHGDVGRWNIQASSSDTNLIANEHLLVFRTAAGGRLLIAPSSGKTGSATVTLVVTDSERQATSTQFALHVQPGSGPLALTVEPEDVTPFPNEAIMLDAGVTSSTPPVFQWFKGASELPGRTNSFLIVTNVQASDAGPYQLRIRTDTETLSTRFVKLHIRAPVSLSFPVLAAGGLTSTKVLGERGDRYSLFAGSSLGAWQWGTTITNEVGWAEYLEKPGSADRFYRALLRP